MFLTIEGGEGAGKTTVINGIIDYFREKNIDYMATREPGGVHIAEDIREVILDTAHTEMDARTEALLYAAARAQHMAEKVEPAIAAGKVIICDRFIDSSLVYQGHARGLGVISMFDINMMATGQRMPDYTFLLDIDPQIGLARIASRVGHNLNRLDREALAFHEKVREGYQMLAGMFPQRIINIDASKSLEEVMATVREHLDYIFGFKKKEIENQGGSSHDEISTIEV